MKNLFTVPRKAAIETLGEKYPKEAKRYSLCNLSTIEFTAVRATSVKKSAKIRATGPQKILNIRIHQGKELAAKDSNGKNPLVRKSKLIVTGLSDPYVIAQIEDVKHKTTTELKVQQILLTHQLT